MILAIKDRHIVVDLDGTLIEEGAPYVILFKKLLFREPVVIVGAVIAYLILGPNIFTSNLVKSKMNLLNLDSPSLLEIKFNKPLVNLLKNLKKAGKVLILATGSDQCVAEAISNMLYKHFHIKFEHIIGSKPGFVCISNNKLEQIRLLTNDFVYIGNSYQDLPIWLASGVDVICIGSTQFYQMIEYRLNKPGYLMRPEFELVRDMIPKLGAS